MKRNPLVDEFFNIVIRPRFNKVDIDDLKAELFSLDWNREVIKAKFFYSMYEDIETEKKQHHVMYCYGHHMGNHQCDVQAKRRDLLLISGHRWCLDCADKRFGAECLICKNHYIQKNPKEKWFFCDDCQKRYVNEIRRVTLHLFRTKKVDQLSTLTIGEWVETLKAFDFSCVYCGGDYECLEHFIPVSAGGGTTANNCVPSCLSCNNRKKDWNPLKGKHRSIPDDRIEAVRQYLATR